MASHQSNREPQKVLPIVPYLRDIGVFSDKIPENSALLILCERSDILGHNPLLPDSYLFKVPLWVYKNGETFRVFNYMDELVGICKIEASGIRVYGREMFDFQESGWQPLSKFCDDIAIFSNKDKSEEIMKRFFSHFSHYKIPIFCRGLRE